MHSGRQKKSLKHSFLGGSGSRAVILESRVEWLCLFLCAAFRTSLLCLRKEPLHPVFPHPLLPVGCMESGMFIPLSPCSFYHVLLPSSWQAALPADQLSPACNNCSFLAPFKPRGVGSFLLFLSLSAPLFLLSSCHPAPTSANTRFSKLLSIKPCVCQLF